MFKFNFAAPTEAGVQAQAADDAAPQPLVSADEVPPDEVRQLMATCMYCAQHDKAT
jgi:hypothetical protein